MESHDGVGPSEPKADCALCSIASGALCSAATCQRKNVTVRFLAQPFPQLPERVSGSLDISLPIPGVAAGQSSESRGPSAQQLHVASRPPGTVPAASLLTMGLTRPGHLPLPPSFPRLRGCRFHPHRFLEKTAQRIRQKSRKDYSWKKPRKVTQFGAFNSQVRMRPRKVQDVTQATRLAGARAVSVLPLCVHVSFILRDPVLPRRFRPSLFSFAWS